MLKRLAAAAMFVGVSLATTGTAHAVPAFNLSTGQGAGCLCTIYTDCSRHYCVGACDSTASQHFACEVGGLGTGVVFTPTFANKGSHQFEFGCAGPAGACAVGDACAGAKTAGSFAGTNCTDVYSTEFCLTACQVPNASISGIEQSDDEAFYYLNCCLVGHSADVGNSGAWETVNQTPFNFTTGFHPGENFLDFVVPNTSGFVTGLDAQVSVNIAVAPEIDPSSAVTPLALLAGAFLVVTERRKKN